MILVTGAGGHLGNVLVRQIAAGGQQVRALLLPNEDDSPLDGLDVQIVRGNILNLDDLRAACSDVDVIFHLAALVAITPGKQTLMRQVNVQGTANVIQIAREIGVSRLVYTSSIHALQRPPIGTVIDERLEFDPLNPAGPYDRTKAEATLLVKKAVQEGLDAVIVCPTGVIGPYDFKRSEMGEMILSWMKNKPSISTDGGFDFVDVRDVAQGHLLAAEKGRPGEVYILSGKFVQVNELRRMVQAAAGVHSFNMHIPTRVARLAAPFAELYYEASRTRPCFTRYSIETLVSNSVISSEKANRELHYHSRDLVRTITETVDWWRTNLHQTKASLRSG